MKQSIQNLFNNNASAFNKNLVTYAQRTRTDWKSVRVTFGPV